ncbi:meiosis-specific with OB domain-containing protein-like [Saccostrea echinata]|uniref:meiosis-specific with OB domain-containing protein-like n=1 Tax=Saccostrea echinata TaxID=191078 RepID=UPI002A82CCF9|nr:meiosis-specific with OB domain-containing protein-like [Saccostrea echinata]
MAWSGHSGSDFQQFKNTSSVTRGNKFQQQERSIAGNNNQFNVKQQQVGNIVKIEDVNQSSSNISVVGVIIAKESPKSIISRKNPGTERHLVSFVIRDSPMGFVSVTCWGSETFIAGISNCYHTGDIVQLSNFQVLLKPTDGSEEKFRPCTPLPFSFSLSENYSTITAYTGYDVEDYQALLHLPTKASNDYYSLEDIVANGQALNGEHINILAILKKVGEVKDITTKTGRQTQRCELTLMDEGLSSFPFVIWDKEAASMASTWTPYNTVLYVADARMSFDSYRSCMVATSDSKTVFTVNPDTQEAHSLYQYAQSCDITEEPDDTKADPPLEKITEKFNVSDVKSVMCDLQTQWKPTVYGVSCLFLSQFNTDKEDPNSVITYRCKKCKHPITEMNGYICSNVECCNSALNLFDICEAPMLGEADMEYRIPVSLSDHSGTLELCYLYGSVAEHLIGVKVENYLKLDLANKTKIKWRFLLERCKVYFKVYRSSKYGGKAVLQIISCSLAHPEDIYNLA